MSKSKMSLAVFVLWLSMLPRFGHAQGTLIWNQTFSISFGGSSIFQHGEFWFGPGYGVPGDPHLFDQIAFGTNDVGRTFTIASSLDDPDFNFVANALTNGVDQRFVFFLGGSNNVGIVSGSLESQLFAGVGTGPDLTGYQVQSFGLQINSATFQSPGQDPNHNGIWTDFSEQVTLNIYGSRVSEPSPFWLVLVGSGVLLYARRIYKQQ